LDEGVLFRTNDEAFVKTRRQLLDSCALNAIVVLPNRTFVNVDADVFTYLLFFIKGKRTERVWYYDLSDIKVGKKTPLTLDRFDDFFGLLPERVPSERSWTVTRAEIEARNYDLKAVNPNRKVAPDTRTPSEILAGIKARQEEIDAALKELGRLIRAQPIA
jgi:type I restriction enzyme M protein